MPRSVSRAFTLIEFMVVAAILAVLATLALNAIQVARESARRMACASNARQLGLATLNYESTFRVLPGAGLGVYLPNRHDDLRGVLGAHQGRWSGFIALSPYLDDSAKWTDIHHGYEAPNAVGGLVSFGPYGFKPPRTYLGPRNVTYHPAMRSYPILRCPSDPGREGTFLTYGGLGRTNYAFCFGDNQRGVESTSIDQEHVRGMFCMGMQYRLEAAEDGLSQTLLFGEITSMPTRISSVSESIVRAADILIPGHINAELFFQPNALQGIDIASCLGKAKMGRYFGTQNLIAIRGFGWMDAGIAYTGFNTILPPNAAMCTIPGSDGAAAGLFPPGSYHRNGAHVTFFDNSVRFVPSSIDTAFPSSGAMPHYYAPGRIDLGGWQETPNWHAPSPFGVWGAMGTRKSSDLVAITDS